MTPSPTPTSCAVFLSYASQDAEAARCLCDALRASGIEVWFDQSELVGGDAWDAKIRQQISTCALFVPVISANTQARLEGYFRIEWKLAAQRTHAMAEAKPFLLPVVIDATRDAEAHVPSEFKTVQWTRLPDGGAIEAFCARVRTLLGGEVARVSRPVSAELTSREIRAAPKVGRRVSAAAWIGLAALAVVAAFLSFRPGPNAGAETRAPTTAPAPTPPAISEKSIAVLPFANLSEDKDSRIFADGVHEDILTNLGLVRELRVIPRTSVEQFRDTKKTTRQIGAELSVAYLLEGSVRRAGNTVRVTGQLIRAATDEHLKVWRFDKELKDIFAIQSAIATEIAMALHTVLSPQERKLVEAAPTSNLEAYELFLQARDIGNRNTEGGSSLRAREKLLEQAVNLDPAFGVAWAQLSAVDSVLYGTAYSMTQVRRARAKEALDTAQRLIPGSPEFRLSSGTYFAFVERNSARATEEFKKAMELAPSAPDAHRAMIDVQCQQGLWRVAMQTAYDVEKMDPGNPQSALTIYTLALSGRRYAEAEAALRRAETRGATELAFDKLLVAFMARGEVPPTPLPAVAYRSHLRELELMCGQTLGVTRAGSPTQEAFVLAAAGDGAAARALLNRPSTQAYLRKNDDEPNNAAAWSNTAVIEALRGNREEAMRRINRALELTPDSLDHGGAAMMRANYVLVLAWTGDKEGALRECAAVLRRPFARDATINDAWIRFHVHGMRHHPAYAPLRGDPRFEALLNDPKNNAPLF